MRERRFLVDPADVGEGRALVRGAELDHLARVLRLRPGDPVGVFDGKGRGYRGRIESLDRGRAVIAIEDPEPGAEPRAQVTLLQGIPHGERMDQIVEKATELGAGRIVPVVTERTTVRPKGPAWDRLERWRRLAVAAAKQSGRAVVPEVSDPLPLEAAIAAEAAWRLVFHPEAGRGPVRLPDGAAPPASAAILIGPEGGLTAGEVEAAAARGFLPAGLGPRTLRADTAAAAALTLVLSALGDLGGRP